MGWIEFVQLLDVVFDGAVEVAVGRVHLFGDRRCLGSWSGRWRWRWDGRSNGGLLDRWEEREEVPLLLPRRRWLGRLHVLRRPSPPHLFAS